MFKKLLDCLKQAWSWVRGHRQEIEEILHLICGVCGKKFSAITELESLLGTCAECIDRAKKS